VGPFFLSLAEVLQLHADQIKRYGGSSGTRDLGLLESAVAMPQSGSGDTYFHNDLFEMAAAYLFHIIRNHPFVDGNKRVGVAAALVFLKLNDIDIKVTNSVIVKVALAVAQGEMGKAAITEFFLKNAKR